MLKANNEINKNPQIHSLSAPKTRVYPKDSNTSGQLGPDFLATNLNGFLTTGN
jgi:hypothetical protein